MKISELTAETVKQYARVRTNDDDAFIEGIIMPAAKAYILSYTGLTATELDAHEELTLADLALCVHYYDNRDTMADNDKTNVIVENILGMFSKNLV